MGQRDDKLDDKLDDSELHSVEHTAIIQPDQIAGDGRPARAFVIVLVGSNAGHMQRVEQELVVGRSKRANLRINDKGASRHHARLFVKAGVAYVEDIGSSNGTYLNGKRVISPVPLRDGDKIQIGATCMLKFSFQDDIEERFQRDLYDAALRDALTRAHNKKALMDHIGAEFAFARRHNSPLSLVMFDLDHFKAVNDTHGHPAGDHVLRSLAEIASDTIRHEDFFARYGGEEFAVVCRNSRVHQTRILGARLRQAIERHNFSFDGKQIPVTISLGIASVPDPLIEDVPGLFAAADSALYAAKNAGRNRVIIHPPSDK
ncbi:MAG: GGDEF domain-containing protein [Nannocystaceae bacterium]